MQKILHSHKVDTWLGYRHYVIYELYYFTIWRAIFYSYAVICGYITLLIMSNLSLVSIYCLQSWRMYLIDQIITTILQKILHSHKVDTWLGYRHYVIYELYYFTIWRAIFYSYAVICGYITLLIMSNLSLVSIYCLQSWRMYLIDQLLHLQHDILQSKLQQDSYDLEVTVMLIQEESHQREGEPSLHRIIVISCDIR